MKLSNLPPKGTTDWLPEEFQIRKYIFDTWRSVCLKFGYQEYLTPLVENAEIYRAKSGEDIGGKELTTFNDRAGRQLAIRPEMTPSVTRMVSRIYRQSPKPLRLFSIANFMRNEKPQRGRNREFWQLNFDIFGSKEIGAEIETVQLALEIMLAFRPPKDSFVIYLNSRKLIDGVLSHIANIDKKDHLDIIRTLDKWDKLPLQATEEKLESYGLKAKQIEKITLFMESSNREDLIKNLPEITKNPGLQEIQQVLSSLKELNYESWVDFKPNIIRGFDYYDGLVFEAFDKHPQNSRAIFGGGRYNGLGQIFGQKDIPAVGFAPGDETTRLFLESWNLLGAIEQDKRYFLPLLDDSLEIKTRKLAQDLRGQNYYITTDFSTKSLGKALDYANKKNFDYIIILGSLEAADNSYSIKNLHTGQEKTIKMTNELP